MSGLSKMVLKGAEKLRPILVKCIPQSILSKVKARMINREARAIAQIDIEKFDKDAFPFGVNLIGDIRVDTGLGQSMRYVSSILDAAGVPNIIYNYYSNISMHNTERLFNLKALIGKFYLLFPIIICHIIRYW